MPAEPANDEPKRIEAAAGRSRATKPAPAPTARPPTAGLGGLRFAPPKPLAPAGDKPEQRPKPKPARKNDPRLVAAARELRDRWLEEVNAGKHLPAANGKYDLSRGLDGLADPGQRPILIPKQASAALALPAPAAA